MTETAQISLDSAYIIARVLETRMHEGQLEVPMLSKVAGRVVAIAHDPDSDISQLTKLIQSDQSLAGHVMRIVNSAAYSTRDSTVSLQQAITRLGMNLISEIALSASISARTLDAPGFEKHIGEIWRHALATALWSKEIARITRCDAEATFLCGLLHSIGRPVVVQTVLEIAKFQDIFISRDQVLELEEIYQQKVGAVVVERWEMPAIVCEVVRYFDEYQSATQKRDECMIVCAATDFATHMLHPDRFSTEILLTLPALSDLSLYQSEVNQLLNLKENITSTMETMTA